MPLDNNRRVVPGELTREEVKRLVRQALHAELNDPDSEFCKVLARIDGNAEVVAKRAKSRIDWKTVAGVIVAFWTGGVVPILVALIVAGKL